MNAKRAGATSAHGNLTGAMIVQSGSDASHTCFKSFRMTSGPLISSIVVCNISFCIISETYYVFCLKVSLDLLTLDLATVPVVLDRRCLTLMSVRGEREVTRSLTASLKEEETALAQVVTL